VGWININPTNGGLTINPVTGSFDGCAWGENIGWIRFKSTDPTYDVAISVQCVYLPIVLRNAP
jgi:hypothetical protein